MGPALTKRDIMEWGFKQTEGHPFPVCSYIQITFIIFNISLVGLAVIKKNISKMRHIAPLTNYSIQHHISVIGTPMY